MAVDDVALLDLGARRRAQDRQLREIAGPAQRRIEGDDDIAEGHDVAGRVLLRVEAAALDVAVMADVVGRAVAPDDLDGVAVSRQRRRRHEDRIEAQPAAGVAFAKDAEAPGEAVAEREAQLVAGGDREADGDGRRGVRRTVDAAAEALLQEAGHEGQPGGAADGMYKENGTTSKELK